MFNARAHETKKTNKQTNEQTDLKHVKRVSKYTHIELGPIDHHPDLQVRRKIQVEKQIGGWA